jgi:EAL domain-containing protein (putative c-di-GMP-specific phosphodiesterase class I)
MPTSTTSAPGRGTSARVERAAGHWERRLREALAEDLFVLHFQPIVALRDGAVALHEALLRLVDPADGRLVPAGRFLPTAERSGLIREIDRAVLASAVAVLAEGGAPAAARPAAIAVNLSALSVTDPGMLAAVAGALDRHGVDPGRLILEITETAAIDDMGAAGAFCAGVRELGCGVALDDFGAGFGSFRYLKHLPFSHVKIDGDFIRGLPDSRTDQLVVRALVDVAHALGARTVAECVGDERTLRLLRGYGVDYAQGFHVGRPAPLLALAA